MNEILLSTSRYKKLQTPHSNKNIYIPLDFSHNNNDSSDATVP